MAEEGYPYQALHSERREIRLLTLESGGPDEPLRCHLSVVALRTNPSYNALSYVWSDPAGSSISEPVIILDSHRFRVTPNLHLALRHLRSPAGSDSICLWVDAVSINQQDTDERNQQVAMMRDIYASATEVTIWLGQADEVSDAAFDAFPLVADRTSWFWRNCEDVKDSQRQRMLKHSGDFFLTLQSSRAWFSRVWILQELALAGSDPIVVCGWKSTSWSTFAAVWQTIAKEPSFGLVSVQKEREAPNGETQFLALTKLDVLHTLRRSTQAQTGESLRRLLVISRTSAATDPRDRIYGLLGLLEQDALDPSQGVMIPVDYRKSCAEVYTDAMSHIFSRGDGPLLLSGVFLSGGPAAAPHIPSLPAAIEQLDLPSWVPDFTRQTAEDARQPNGMAFLPPSTMNASGAGSGANNGNIVGDGRTLQVEGLFVDIIDEALPFGSSLEAIVESLPRLETTSAIARRRPCLFDPAVASHMQQFRGSEPLWRTLISNKHVKSGYEPAPAWYEETYLNLLNAARPEDKLSKHSDDAQKPDYELALRACIGRKSFFTSKSGFTGTCVPTSRKDDVIAIVFGSPTPFVLRPLPPGDDERVSYSLIGTCYTGGIMNGEMVDELYCEDLMDSTTFHIR
jgi:hypothetical protein